MSKLFEKKELQEVVDWLKENFPKAFPSNAKRIKPLQLGIMDQIFEFYDRLSYPPFSKKRLRAGINFYTSSPAYLKSQQEGCFRVDLFGHDEEIVSSSQAEYAKERLEQYQKNKQGNIEPSQDKDDEESREKAQIDRQQKAESSE